jgi:dipeptidyl aminopeptidase/acylaminoacyl peptidase
MTTNIAGLACAGLLLAGQAWAADKPQPIEDFIKHPEYSAAKISPNGKYLAITVEQEGQTILVTLDVAKLDVVKTTRLPEDKSVEEFYWVGPERLMFNASRHIGRFARPFLTGDWYAVNADGTQPRTLLSYATSGGAINQTKQASFGESYAMLDPVPENPAQVLMTALTATSSRIVSLDTMSGQRRDVARIGEKNCSFALGADRAPAYAVCFDDKGEGNRFDMVSKLFRYAGGQWSLANDSKSDGRHLTVVDTAPDGRIYATADDKVKPAAFGLLDGKTGEFKQLYQNKNADPAGYLQGTDGHTILGVITEAAVPQVELVDATAADTKIYLSLAKSFPGQFVNFTSATADGKKIVVSVASDRNPGELYLFDRDSGQARFLIRNRMQLDPDKMASVKAFSFTTRDGLTEFGYLTIPKGSDGKNMPLIVNPHGGPMGPRDNWTFNWEPQLLASRGYAVLQVNYRGSGGYGQAFQEKSYGQWAQGIMNDIIDATHWAIQQGYADKDRICIYGGSFGGYASLMAPAREPGLFKCAFGYVGLYDAQIQLSKSDTSKSDGGRRFLNRAFGSTRAEQDAMSPITYADKLKLPIYLAAGARDPRCPPEHTEAMSKALTAAGNPPEGVIIQSGEMHGYYKDENNLNLYTKMLAFFGEHIGGNVTVESPAQVK